MLHAPSIWREPTLEYGILFWRFDHTSHSCSIKSESHGSLKQSLTEEAGNWNSLRRPRPKPRSQQPSPPISAARPAVDQCQPSQQAPGPRATVRGPPCVLYCVLPRSGWFGRGRRARFLRHIASGVPEPYFEASHLPGSLQKFRQVSLSNIQTRQYHKTKKTVHSKECSILLIFNGLL